MPDFCLTVLLSWLSAEFKLPVAQRAAGWVYTAAGGVVKRWPMCPVEIDSNKIGGVYVDGQFTMLPYTVASGEKKLISHKYPPGFRYWVFGMDRGGCYMDAYNPFS